jgi:soluble lytic murein transglycosylase
MSSMWRASVFLPALLAISPSSSAQSPVPYAQPQAAYAAPAADVGYALNDWRRLRQSSGYSFADYARFLIANPNWPDEAKMRRWAEKAMRPGENAATVIAFSRSTSPRAATAGRA